MKFKAKKVETTYDTGFSMFTETKIIRAPWSELSKDEKNQYSRKIIRRGVSVIAVAAAVYLGKEYVLGDSPEPLSHDAKVSAALSAGSDIYSSQLSGKDKFTVSFVSPQHTRSPELESEGGAGLIGWAGRNSNSMIVYVGQNCLAGSGFDPYAENPATVVSSESGDGVSIVPSGSSESFLDFTYNAQGILEPSEHSAHTLRENGCVIGDNGEALRIRAWSSEHDNHSNYGMIGATLKEDAINEFAINGFMNTLSK